MGTKDNGNMILSISNLSIIRFNFLYIRFVKQNLNHFCTKPHNVGPIPRPHSTLIWALADRFWSAVVTLVQSVKSVRVDQLGALLNQVEKHMNDMVLQEN